MLWIFPQIILSTKGASLNPLSHLLLSPSISWTRWLPWSLPLFLVVLTLPTAPKLASPVPIAAGVPVSCHPQCPHSAHQPHILSFPVETNSVPFYLPVTFHPVFAPQRKIISTEFTLTDKGKEEAVYCCYWQRPTYLKNQKWQVRTGGVIGKRKWISFCVFWNLLPPGSSLNISWLSVFIIHMVWSRISGWVLSTPA